MTKDKKQSTIKLPERLVSSVDLSRITRELKALDIWLTQASLRSGGQTVTAPKTSATLEEIASLNNVSLLEKDQREQLVNVLSSFLEHAPKIHMSFAVEPSAVFLNRMIVWLRANINPIVLLEIGLQPTITAGCTVRTDNKVFDMSLRHRFVDSRPLLVQSIAKFQNSPINAPPTQSPASQNITAPVPPKTAEVSSTSSPESKPAENQASPQQPATNTPEEVKPESQAHASSPPQPVARSQESIAQNTAVPAAGPSQPTGDAK